MNPQPSTDYVIVTHGYTDNRMGALKYVPCYLDLGFNCVIWDLRGHGENEPAPVTYGLVEGQDLAALVRVVRERHADANTVGLHGESLGAATTICALAHDPDIAFCVSDCAFADIEGVLRAGYAAQHLPSALFDLADIGYRVRYGYALKDMRPIDALAQSDVPILIIHGAADELIAPDHARRLAAAAGSASMLHIVEGAGHAESVLVAKDEYHKVVADFLATVLPGR